MVIPLKSILYHLCPLAYPDLEVSDSVGLLFKNHLLQSIASEFFSLNVYSDKIESETVTIPDLVWVNNFMEYNPAEFKVQRSVSKVSESELLI